MSPQDTRNRVDFKYLQQRRQAILAGDAYPEHRDRLMGCPPYRDSPHTDLRYLAETEIVRAYLPATVMPALEKLASAPSRWTAGQLRAALLADDELDYGDQVFALTYCMALLGDETAQNEVARTLLKSRLANVLAAHGAAAAFGFLQAYSLDREETSYAAGNFDALLVEGFRRLARAAEMHGIFETTRAVATFDDAVADVAAAIKDDLQDVDPVTLMLEDRSDNFTDPGPRSLQLKVDGLVVIPTAPDVTSARKDNLKGWTGKIGVALPLVRRGDVFAQRQALIARFPHAVELVDTVLGDLAASEYVRFRPTLFVGAPGSGKSSLARAIFDVVGLQCELYSLAGIHDASMMGTSAQWASARESAPLQVIKRSGFASVGMIWDEVEKVGTRKDAGSALDAMLPMLEIDQARRYRDLALEVEVDLSMVSHFGTANSLDDIPAPLKDRMRILVMPDPTWKHLGSLTSQIIGRLARERGVDERWYQALAEDELDLVRANWPGGSLRQLTRIVTTIIDGRDRIIGRC